MVTSHDWWQKSSIHTLLQSHYYEDKNSKKSKEIETDASFITSTEQENAELKPINIKLAKEITECELKSEIQKYIQI